MTDTAPLAASPTGAGSTAGSPDLWLTVEAADVLFFRDGLPFEAGDSYWARGTWPPDIMAVQGAIRTLLLGSRLAAHGWHERWVELGRLSPGDPLIQAYGRSDDLGRLSFRGPWPIVLSAGAPRVFLPPPGDLRFTEHGKQYVPSGLEKVQRQRLRVSGEWQPPCLISKVEEKLRPATWLSAGSLKKHLLNEPISGAEVFGDTLPEAVRETRVGLRLDETSRRVVTGQFYRKEVRRPSRVSPRTGLCVGVQGIDKDDHKLLENAVGRFGGEGYSARMSRLDSDPLTGLTAIRSELRSAVDAAGGFRLVLLTPALYTGYPLPHGVDPSSGRWCLEGRCAGTLQAAVVGKPVYISGWDRLRHAPKRMLRAMPAGSVFFFELNGKWTAAEMVQRFHLGQLPAGLDGAGESYYRALGYGTCAVGAGVPVNGGK